MKHLEVIPTDHAIVRLLERGISIDEVKFALIHGVHSKQDDGTMIVHTKNLKVIYQQQGKAIVIVTAVRKEKARHLRAKSRAKRGKRPDFVDTDY